MEIKKFVLIFVLIFQSPALLFSNSVETYTLKCFPSHGSCTRLESQLLIIRKWVGEEIRESIRCKPKASTHKRSKRRVCLLANTTRGSFELKDGGLLGQTYFPEVSDLIRQFSFSEIRIFSVRVRGFNAQSPLIIDASSLKMIEFHLDVSPFEFFDNNRNLVRSCEDFEKLNSSSFGFFFGFNAGQDNNPKINQTIDLVVLENVRFENKPICELVFSNMQIRQLTVNFLIETFFKKSVPRFIKSNSSAQLLNTNVTTLTLVGYYVHLTDSLLSNKVNFCFIYQIK